MAGYVFLMLVLLLVPFVFKCVASGIFRTNFLNCDVDGFVVLTLNSSLNEARSTDRKFFSSEIAGKGAEGG